MTNQGFIYERAAETFLRQAGLELIERNFRGDHGEIDLIMLDYETLVFIEVRQRRNSRFYSAAGSVSAQKQSRIIKTALAFLKANPKYQNTYCRFDVMAYRDLYDSPLWIKSAFTEE
ncbi:MAG: YraN family protein [Halieaceae bacterium]|nr:YraN family protein [Halieaceae bacterium]